MKWPRKSAREKGSSSEGEGREGSREPGKREGKTLSNKKGLVLNLRGSKESLKTKGLRRKGGVRNRDSERRKVDRNLMGLLVFFPKHVHEFTKGDSRKRASS